MRPGLYAFVAAASFLGATTYIGLVEQPARLALSGAAMLREWEWNNRRGTLVLSAFAVISAILTALIIIVAFISATFSIAHEYGVAILFMGALLMFCVSLIDLARETRISLHDNDLRA